ncbi:hypothetical protein [uncultured Robinsoniella sp.]
MKKSFYKNLWKRTTALSMAGIMAGGGLEPVISKCAACKWSSSIH